MRSDDLGQGGIAIFIGHALSVTLDVTQTAGRRLRALQATVLIRGPGIQGHRFIVTLTVCNNIRKTQPNSRDSSSG